MRRDLCYEVQSAKPIIPVFTLCKPSFEHSEILRSGFTVHLSVMYESSEQTAIIFIHNIN